MKQEDKAFLELVEKYKTEKKLSDKDIEIMERWKFAHDLEVNEFKYGKDLEEAIIEKYDVSIRTARYDISNSRKFFITEQMIDKDYWRGLLLRWQLKGLKMAFDDSKHKEFNAGIRNLYLILGLHKSGKGINPKLLKQNIFNFFSDPAKIGIPEVQEAEIIELIDEVIKGENVTPEERNKLLKDAGIHRDEQS